MICLLLLVSYVWSGLPSLTEPIVLLLFSSSGSTEDSLTKPSLTAAQEVAMKRPHAKLLSLFGRANICYKL